MDITSPDELEVVKISSSTALDRALLKEKKRTMQHLKEKQQQQQQEEATASSNTMIPVTERLATESFEAVTTDDQTVLPESMGQELLWIEEAPAAAAAAVSSPKQPSPVKKVKKKGLLFGRRSASSSSKEVVATTPKVNKTKANKTNEGKQTQQQRQHQSNRVVLLRTTPSFGAGLNKKNKNANRIHQQAAAKAQHARELLDRAMLVDDNTTSNDRREELLKNAFSEAAQARRLVDPESVITDMELQQTMSLGEKEAQEASRLLLVVPTSGSSSSSDMSSPEKKKPTKKRATPRNIMAAANEHAEAARRYLESMLPAFLDGAVSEDEEEEEEAPAAAAAVVATTTNKGAAIKPKGAIAALEEDDDEEYDDDDDDDDDDIDAKYTADELKRRAENKQATITRIVQQNNTMISTLGFDNDNTYRDEVLTIDSLNDFLDAPLSMEGGPGLKGRNKVVIEGKAAADRKLAAEWKEAKEAKLEARKAADRLARQEKEAEEMAKRTAERRARQEKEAEVPVVKPPRQIHALTTTTMEQEEPTKTRSKLAFFSRGGSKPAVPVSPKKNRRSSKVDKFVATVLPDEDKELDKPDEEELEQLAQVGNINDATTKRLEEALDEVGSVISYDGVPKHNGFYKPNATPPRDKSTSANQPQFIAAPKIASPLSSKSWDDMAAGAVSLTEVIGTTPGPDDEVDEVVAKTLNIDRTPSERTMTKDKKEKSRFRLFGRKKSKKTAVAMTSTSGDTDMEKPALAPITTDNTTDQDDPAQPSPPGIVDGVGNTGTTGTQSEDLGDQEMDPHSISMMTDDSYMRMAGEEPDRYTAMADVEDQVHEEARQRLQRQKPIVSDVDMMPSNPIPMLLRQVFTWGENDHDDDGKNDTAIPIHIEVDGGNGDKSQMILANKQDVVNAINTPRTVAPVEGSVKLTRSVTATDQHNGIQASNSFMEKMDAAIEEHAQKRANNAKQQQQQDEEAAAAEAAKENSKPPKKKKKGRFKALFKKQPAAALV